MKLSYLFIIFLTVFTVIAFPVLSQDDSLLPEKTSVSAGSSSSASATVDAEEIPWNIIVFALMIGGLILMFFEIAIIPGFGVTGISGLVLLFGAMILAYLKMTLAMAAFVILLGIASVVFLIYWFTSVFPTTAIGKKFVLSSEASVSNDGLAVENYDHMIGAEGIATSMLRPSGIAKINGERYDVITEGEFIEKDTPIFVKKAEAGRIIVSAKV